VDRRAFIMGAVISQIGPLIARAQAPGKVSRVAVLGPVAFDSDSAELGAFRQRLADLGWVAGRNLELVLRDAGGQYDRLPDVAAELVRLKVDVIVTITTPGAEAAKRATSTIPIVMAGSGDPVRRGLVASLARPGGNITGLTNYPGPEFVVKQLQLLKEVAPRISRAAVLMSSSFPPTVDSFAAMQAAGGTLGVTPLAIEMNRPGAFDPTVVLRERADALVVSPIPLNWAHHQAILDLAAKHRLPAMYGENDWVKLGGLMSYWTDWLDLRRRAAVYVDKILKGARPADLPVEEPTRFELVINLKTAKALGLTIPPSVLARADKLIQ
jgi:putative ABC transport system substrate-binding protein